MIVLLLQASSQDEDHPTLPVAPCASHALDAPDRGRACIIAHDQIHLQRAVQLSLCAYMRARVFFCVCVRLGAPMHTFAAIDMRI